MAKAEISWTTESDEGVKRDVYAQRIGDRWKFFSREKRYDKWEHIPDPPLQEWLKLLDGVRRRVNRRLLRPEEEKRVMKTISELYPGTRFDNE
jgi:hypothetical protein